MAAKPAALTWCWPPSCCWPAGQAQRQCCAVGRVSPAGLARHLRHPGGPEQPPERLMSSLPHNTHQVETSFDTRPAAPAATPERPLLDVHVRRKAFGQRTVLNDFRLRLQAGEVVSLIGSSGCGKSTLLRIIAGLDPDYEGSVRVNGLDRWGTTRDIGFVFQEPRLFPWLSVAGNIAFDPERPNDARQRVETLLQEVGLQGLGQRLPKQLSGGQAQRVAIARGLFTHPLVLLLDDVEEAALLSDRVLVLDNQAGNAPRELPIALPRPRERSDAALAALRHELLLALEAAHAL